MSAQRPSVRSVVAERLHPFPPEEPGRTAPIRSPYVRGDFSGSTRPAEPGLANLGNGWWIELADLRRPVLVISTIL
jgi:hypothetical protein